MTGITGLHIGRKRFLILGRSESGQNRKEHKLNLFRVLNLLKPQIETEFKEKYNYRAHTNPRG